MSQRQKMTNPTAQWYRHRAQLLLNGGFIENAAYCMDAALMFESAERVVTDPAAWHTAGQLGAEVINGYVECSECGEWAQDEENCAKCGLPLLPF